ncbi:hypothetical protein IFR05_003193 [Cadophora sp. M221]|nr:hypothetical protein IFR05_003193 [Cadophora sp. M221]
MELSLSLLNELGGSFAAFLPIPSQATNKPTRLATWDSSRLNPKNRIDSLDLPTEPKWRIDGYGLAGCQVFAYPKFIQHNNLPLRVDVFLPDQNEVSEALRYDLQWPKAADAIGSNFSGLAISRYILRALQSWSDRERDFEEYYTGLPFGSKIVVEEIALATQNSRISVTPGFDLERRFLSVKSLQSLWSLPEKGWPPSIQLPQVRLVRQIHESISLVQIPHLHGAQIFAMKTHTADPKHLYHELKTLLTMPPHVNIIKPPLYIVTKKSAFGGKQGVCSFILEYYSHGTLRDILMSRTLTGTLALKDQQSWARQIVSALIHINEKAGSYYSDLKPDNILLVPTSSTEGELTPLVIDFEQRGNGAPWSHPSILYTQYLKDISLSPKVTPDIRSRYDSLFQAHIAEHISAEDASHLKKGAKYANPAHGYNLSWLSLSPQERESAQVHNLGMFLWCLFEGIPYPHRELWVESAFYPFMPYEFPEMRRSPEDIRKVIRMCMGGSGVLDVPRRHLGLVRRGSLVIPKGREEDVDISEDEVVEAAREYWKEEIDRLEGLWLARDNAGGVVLGQGGMACGTPTLKEVLIMLEEDID